MVLSYGYYLDALVGIHLMMLVDTHTHNYVDKA
jgi:hypothetical protein